MKKVWLFATAAIAFGTSCTKDNVGGIDDSTQQEIVLGAGSAVNVSQAKASRGIGAVGDLEGSNSWNGETVYIYGINTSKTGDEQFYINGQSATAPKDGVSGILSFDKLTKPYYYNGNDIYDFYGVHVDDAVKEPATEMVIPNGTNLDESGFAVNVNIDGTQDLMVATPNKTKDIENAQNDDLTGHETSLYSAWSSRRNVVPNLIFNHLLTQIRFNAKTGSETPQVDDNAIKIKSIEIKKVINSGSIKIIGGDQGFTPNMESRSDFYAKAVPTKKGDKLTDFPIEGVSVTAKKSDDFVPISAPVLLYPEDKYEIIIRTSQTLGEGQTVEDEIKGTIKASNASGGTVEQNDKFQSGTLYNVNITVYDVENISVSGELIEWKFGGNIDIDPDDMPNIPESEI